MFFSSVLLRRSAARALQQQFFIRSSVFLPSSRQGLLVQRNNVGGGQCRCVSSTTTDATTTTTTVVREERPRRALFSVPGADERKIAKAASLKADAIVLDLEDGVPFHKKDLARMLVSKTLAASAAPVYDFGNSEICVRINALDTKELAMNDLMAILPCERLDAIVIPKVETPMDIEFVSRMIDAYAAPRGDIRIIAAIESALGFLNIRDIAAMSSSSTGVGSRLDALVFASEDYCNNIEAIRTTDASELLAARAQLVMAAKAYGLQAIDMVHIQFRDLQALQVECQRGRELGMTGKQAIHPNQVAIIQTAFSPNEKDVAFARRVVQTYTETTLALGKGACVVDGIVVDAPVYKWANKILKRAEAAGMLDQ